MNSNTNSSNDDYPYNYNMNIAQYQNLNSNLYNFGAQQNFEGNNINRSLSTFMQSNENPISNQNSMTAQQVQHHQQQLLQRHYNLANYHTIQNTNNSQNMQNYIGGSAANCPLYNIPNIRQMNQQGASYYPQNMAHESAHSQTGLKSPSLSDIWKEDRRIFLMFIHTLFKCMKKFNSAKQEEELLSKAKTIINECTKKNRAGVPNYSPLSEVISSRLKSLDGMQVYWDQAEKYVLKYHSRKNSDLSNKSSHNEMIPL